MNYWFNFLFIYFTNKLTSKFSTNRSQITGGSLFDTFNTKLLCVSYLKLSLETSPHEFTTKESPQQKNPIRV